MSKDILSTTISFNLELIKPGYLVILYDERSLLIGSGVIIKAEPLEIRTILYMGQATHLMDIRRYSDDPQGLLEQVSPYYIQIEQVEKGEVKLYVLDPGDYGGGL